MARNFAKAAAVPALIGFGMLLFAGGIVFGIWFSANFRIVPRGDMEKMLKDALENNPELSKLVSGESPEVAKAVDSLLASQPSASKDLAKQILKSNSKNGPFAFKFKKGERLQYTLSASMKGEGNDTKMTAPASFDLGGKFELATESVDDSGNGVVRMAFKDTALKGDMMGTPFTLTQNLQIPEQPGAAQGGVQPENPVALPLLAFLNAPIRMSVAPNGTARELPDPSRPNPVIQEIPMLTSIEFPQSEMTPGTQWQSNFDMSVPGSSVPMRVKMVNTFTGYKTIGTRVCAVIDQKVDSEPVPPQPASPGAALGMAVGIKPPQIDLSGNNKVYFDTDNGQLVHSEMDMAMHLDASDSLASAGKILDGLGVNIKSLLGETPTHEDKKAPAEETGKPNPLDLKMKINAAVSLVDPIAAKP